MNRNQRIVLIAAGAIIVLFQVYGISEYGLEDSRGWPVSFLIAAVLLFVGLGTWKSLPAFLSKPAAPAPPPAPPVPLRSNKHQYGVHISELDLTIETHKTFAHETKIYVEGGGNGRSVNWNCAASVYASIRYVFRKTDIKINKIIWNTIVRAVVIRMSTEETPGVGMGGPEFTALEAAAYEDIKAIDAAVDDALAGEKGKFAYEPVVKLLALMFGTSGEALKALSAMVGMNAETAHKKIIPELVEDFS